MVPLLLVYAVLADYAAKQPESRWFVAWACAIALITGPVNYVILILYLPGDVALSSWALSTTFFGTVVLFAATALLRGANRSALARRVVEPHESASTAP